MPVLSGWPVITDDSGGGQDGTIINKSVTDAVRASVEASINSPTNPTITPIATTDEVVVARGSKASVGARLNVSLNADGTLILPATVGLAADISALYGHNLAPNSDFLLWPSGTTNIPSYWTLSGAGAVIARADVSGLAGFVPGMGQYGPLLTYGSQEVKLTQSIISSVVSTMLVLRGRRVYLSARVLSAVANAASIVIDDGVSPQRSSYHTGSGSVETLSVTTVISNTATKLDIYLSNGVAGDAYFGAVMCAIANEAPTPVPCAMQKGVIQFVYSGAVATGTDLGDFIPGAPGIVTDVQLYAKTAPTGQALIVDVNLWDGAAFTSMFTTRPQIAAGVKRGVAQAPDAAAYNKRCFTHDLTATGITGSLISYDVDQVGSGVAGADLTIAVRTRQYIRPLESLLPYSQF